MVSLNKQRMENEKQQKEKEKKEKLEKEDGNKTDGAQKVWIYYACDYSQEDNEIHGTKTEIMPPASTPPVTPSDNSTLQSRTSQQSIQSGNTQLPSPRSASQPPATPSPQNSRMSSMLGMNNSNMSNPPTQQSAGVAIIYLDN